MHKTAVVILNRNGLGFLKMFLQDVVKRSADDETVVYVADNGSTDGSPEWISANIKDVRLIRLDKNYGFAGGYNLVLSQLDTRYFVLLNSDIEVSDGWLQPLVSFMDSNPEVASCQPKIRSYSNKDFFEYAGAAGCFIDKYGYPFCRGRIFDIIEKDSGQYDSPADVFWSSGACMIVRRAAWEKCKGFDTGFFAHMEEIDLCWRFHSSGYRVSCQPRSVVYHVGGGALPYGSPFKTYLNFRNNLFLLYKNLPERKLHNTLFKRKLLDGIAFLYFLFKLQFRNAGAVFKAHWDFYKSLGELKMKRKAVSEMQVNNFSDKILNKSIVFEFYIRGKKSYQSLITEH